MKRKVEAIARRDGGWWVFEIPELGADAPNGVFMRPFGQAKTAAKVAEEAQDVAALWEDGDPDDFEVTVRYVLSKDIEDARQRAEELEESGRAELDEAARLRREAVRAVLASNLSQVDAAAVLGMSRQRVQQLA